MTDIHSSTMREYSQQAEKYDARWAFYIDATMRETIARLKLRSTERLLDVGCGTGELLRRLLVSHPAAQLSGLDPVPAMLSVARRKLSASIDLREGWADQLPFATAQFDVVVSCSMFHYIHHPVAALREIRRVLRPGGRLLITDWCDDYITCRVCQWYLRLLGRADFKVYRKRECITMLNSAGYTVIAADRYKINWLWGLMTITGISN